MHIFSMGGKGKINFDDNSSESEEEKETELQKQLADVPIGELQKARADGSHKSYKKPMGENPFKRANKNRPTEMSSKTPVGRFREVIQVPKKVGRDPRFESLCGNLDQDGFRKRYKFLYEVELPEEKKKLQKIIKESKDPKVVEELQNHIAWIDSQLRSARSSRNSDAAILAEHKKKEREAAKQGKKPFYLKKSEIREKRLVQKYDGLKASGKLESYITKRRKKNASKDHRYMPYRRDVDS